MPIPTFTLEELWVDADFKPNDEQKEAIRHIDGPLYLPAGPGSGKTRVLLWRTVNLIVYHAVLPEEIFLSTFTEKAALQLKEGLRALLGAVTTKANIPYDVSNMYVGTVHSLCRHLITDRRFSPNRRRRRAPLLLDEIDQYLYLYKRARWTQLTNGVGYNDDANERITDYLSRQSKSKHHAVTDTIAFFNRLSEECIVPEAAKDDADNDELKTLLDFYAQYLKSLQEPKPAGTVDFSLLQQRAFDSIQTNPNFGSIFKHVIIDEYQDTNPIQERIFFKLAKGYKNICVVGDDDQALYRFRGATVENFVQFPARCESELGTIPHQITLTKNYRSRKKIVAFYNDFMDSWDWTKSGTSKGKPYFRIDKEIEAERKDSGPSVVASTPGKPVAVCPEIALKVKELLDLKIVSDPNQIAFLFPSLKSKSVQAMKEALEAHGLKVYAPRAGRFLEVPEAEDIFAVFVRIFGRPTRGEFPGQDYSDFHNWLDRIEQRGAELINQDPQLKHYVADRRKEITTAVDDYRLLLDLITAKKWDLNDDYSIETMKRPLASVAGLSDRARRSLSSSYFDRIVRDRMQQFELRLSDAKPFSLKYMIRRATAMDWSLLDLFYRICGFRHFTAMFDLAEHGHDEGPIANLSLITQYLERFIEQYTPMITADILADDRLQQLFFASYLFAIFRRGESEYEDAEDPFPKGRIPFITIHQAKGLEFPVVVLGNATMREHGIRRIEEIIRPLTHRESEPLERMDGFDSMRMFYVALSRARDLLVIADYRGQGYPHKEPFASMLEDLPKLPNFNVKSVPEAELPDLDLPKSYSYTSDYLFYRKCPRQYMVFRKYGFVESRSQTMFFGSLVHETLEDLHQYLIDQRNNQ